MDFSSYLNGCVGGDDILSGALHNHYDRYDYGGKAAANQDDNPPSGLNWLSFDFGLGALIIVVTMIRSVINLELRPEKSSHELAVDLPRDIPPYDQDVRCRAKVIRDATSHNLGWVELQAVRYRDNSTNEIQASALSQHLLVVITKPPTAPITLGGNSERQPVYRRTNS